MESNAASSQALGNDAPQPAHVDFAAESLAAGLNANASSQKRSRETKVGVVKIEDIHRSLDNLEQIQTLISAVKNYLTESSDGATKNTPAVECLEWSVGQLACERKWISEKLNCSREKKESKKAHAKVSKEQRQQAAHLTVVANKRSLTTTPRKRLISALSVAKELIRRDSAVPLVDSAVLPTDSLPRQKKPRNQTNAASSDKPASIPRLPLPADRVHLM